MTPYEILVLAKEKISKPENWTKSASARNKNGEDTYPTNSDAVCFCSIGAIQSVSKYTGDEAIDILRRVLYPNNWYGVAAFNDSHLTTHEDVMKAFDKAIEAAC
jgi:hypothetical protein